MYWIYTSIIRPILTYASFLWWKEAYKVGVNKKLTQLQRLACLYTTGVMQTTPTAALEVALELLPLNIFIEREAMRTTYRLQIQNLLKKNSNGHGGVLNKLIAIEPILSAPSDKIKTVNVFNKSFTTVFPTRESWILHAEETRPREGLIFYTDGSYQNGRAGAGIFSEACQSGESFALGKHTTVFQAEVYAILVCAQNCSDKKIKNTKISICSDSKASLLALSSFKITSSIVLQCWNTLQAISQQNVVELIWVPGHHGIVGNEKADELARLGSESLFCGPEPCLPITTNITQQITKDWASKTHVHNWNATTNCRQSKKWLKLPSSKNTKYLLGLSRSQLRLLLSLITGHCQLNYHLHKMGLKTESTCHGCLLEAETSEHYICSCPHYARLRQRIFGRPILNAAEFSAVTASDILRFANLSKRFMPT